MCTRRLRYYINWRLAQVTSRASRQGPITPKLLALRRSTLADMVSYLVRVNRLLLIAFQFGSGAPPGLGEVSLPTPVSFGGALRQGGLADDAEDAQAHVPLAEAMIEYADHRNPTSDGMSTVGSAALAPSTAASSSAPFLEFDNPDANADSCTAPQVMTEGSFPTSGSTSILAKVSLPIPGLLGEQHSTATAIHTQSAPTSSMPNPSVHVMSTESDSTAGLTSGQQFLQVSHKPNVGRTLGQRIMDVSHRYNLFMMSSIMCIVIFMQAAGDNGGGSNRDPPAWGPEQESTYPFREYSHDILLWIFQTNLQLTSNARL